MFLWFLKEDVTRSRGYIGGWGVVVTHVYLTEARVESG
jgi:hypothetical protein